MSQSVNEINNVSSSLASLARNSLNQKRVTITTTSQQEEETAMLKKRFSSPTLDIKKKLTAESLRVLSNIQMDKRSLNSQFDLLFNDMSTLKAAGNANSEF